MSELLPLEQLRSKVIETVEKHWIKPQIVEQPEPVPREQLDDVSRAALDTMLTRQYRVGPLPGPAVYDQLLRRVRFRVARNQPIAVSVGYGPLKNPNAVAYSRADWAEFFALCHLIAWHNKVQTVYAPGLAVSIAFDDTTLVMANHANKDAMRSYMASIPELIRRLGFERIISAAMRHSFFAWLFHLGLYRVARYRVGRWERDPAHREQLDKMHECARRNLALPSGLSPEGQEMYIRGASHRYRVYWEALQLSCLTKGPRRLVAMYLDGTQHHIPQPVALHLTSLDKGQVTQPWQGPGALLDNGRGKLEPFVLTRGRQERYTSRVVEGLDFPFGTGYDRLAVVEAPKAVTAAPPADAPPVVVVEKPT